MALENPEWRERAAQLAADVIRSFVWEKTHPGYDAWCGVYDSLRELAGPYREPRSRKRTGYELALALSSAFYWQATPQGWAAWNSVWYSLRRIEA